jgi:hypothetical protein
VAIDIDSEDMFPISDVPKRLKSRPHIATCWRWIHQGCRGVKLETVSIGARRYTSQAALQRFVERTTAAADGEPIPARTVRQREKAIAAAERELAAAGI